MPLPTCCARAVAHANAEWREAVTTERGMPPAVVAAFCEAHPGEPFPVVPMLPHCCLLATRRANGDAIRWLCRTASRAAVILGVYKLLRVQHNIAERERWALIDLPFPVAP